VEQKREQALVFAADTRLGEEIAIKLFRQGYELILSGRDIDKLKSLARFFGDKTSYFIANIDDLAQLEHELIRERQRRRNQGEESSLKIIADAADALCFDDSLKSMNECLGVNCRGTYNVLKLAETFIDYGGHIGMVNSLMSLIKFPGQFENYALTKEAAATCCEEFRDNSLIKGKATITVAYPMIVETDAILTEEAKKQAVYAAFPHQPVWFAAEVIVRDMLAGESVSFLTRSDWLMAKAADIAPKTLEKLIRCYVKHKTGHT